MASRKHHVCYYAIPRSIDKDVRKPLTVEDLDPFLCTHLLVAFATIKNNKLVPVEEKDKEIYQEVVALKRKNPELKVLLSVGGATCNFSDLVKDPSAVEIFASETREFLLGYGFDGLDIDWEFPAWPVLTSDCREKKWFTRLVRQLSYEFTLVPSTPLLLTLAVAAPKSIINASYEVNQLAKYVDFVCLMGYDYHVFWPYFPLTGHNSPLFQRKNEVHYFATMNIAWSADQWVKKGMPKEKFVVGIPTYGRTWKLLKKQWHGVYAPATGEGMLKGTTSYPDAFFFVQEGADYYFDEESRVPYAVRDCDWVSFDDPESIREKTQWIKESGYAGVMVFSLNADDWAGVCSGKNFELTSVVKDVLSHPSAE